MNLQSCRLNVRKNFFNAQILTDWNALPEAVKNATTTNSFKNLYDNFKTSKNTNFDQVDAT